MTPGPLVVLGATGSIGTNALDVARRLSVPVVAVAAHRPGPELASIARAHPDAAVVVTGGSSDERHAFDAEIDNAVEFGEEALLAVAARPHSTVINGIVGAAGLLPTVAAAHAGNRIALANKESLVAGGSLVTAAARDNGAELIPVDSEHSALFQLLRDASEVASLTITASGGPFRGRSRAELADVTPAEALDHPTWDMGRRISIDSATLANKGLEVIEAHVLFGIPYERIRVVVHPQSIVHSLVSLADGSMLAHVGATDMRIPIQYAITHPDRMDTGIPFDLAGRSFEFEEPDRATFRALDLAYDLGRGGGVGPCVFNAADEVAVSAFLGGEVAFLDIPRVIEDTAEAMRLDPARSVDQVLEVDAEARRRAWETVARLKRRVG